MCEPGRMTCGSSRITPIGTSSLTMLAEEGRLGTRTWRFPSQPVRAFFLDTPYDVAMSLWQFLLRSLAFHWRMHLAVALGVAAATAVLTGALLVGDSVRGSLKHLALDRLGEIGPKVIPGR